MPTKAQSEQRKKALKPFKKGERTSEEQARLAKMGGKASGEARREKKLFKEEILKRMGEQDWDEMINNIVDKSKSDLRYAEFLRDTIGQKPVQDVNLQGEADLTIKVGVNDD